MECPGEKIVKVRMREIMKVDGKLKKNKGKINKKSDVRIQLENRREE